VEQWAWPIRFPDMIGSVRLALRQVRFSPDHLSETMLVADVAGAVRLAYPVVVSLSEHRSRGHGMGWQVVGVTRGQGYVRIASGFCARASR